MRWLYRLEKEKVEVKEDKGVGLQSEVTRVLFFFSSLPNLSKLLCCVAPFRFHDNKNQSLTTMEKV